MKAKTKAIITGGAGFIGSHLAEELIANGYQVTVLDNFSTGRSENLERLRADKRFSLVSADIAEFKQIEKYFQDVDYIFHLAALADIVPSIKNPIAYHRANVNGTVSALEAARKCRVKKFIYAASSSCYGIADKFPTDEKAPILPEYPYALSKYIGEEYVRYWSKIYKLPFISLRLFNVYGPRARTSGAYGAVFGVFLAQKLAGRKFTVVGDGTQTRDFVFVQDVVRAFRIAGESEIVNEVFNIGSGQPQSVNRLVELMEGEAVYIPKRPAEPEVTYADISKVKRMLDWRPQVSFEQGVAIMLAHIGDWRNAPLWTAETIAEATHEWFEHLSPKQ